MPDRLLKHLLIIDPREPDLLMLGAEQTSRAARLLQLVDVGAILEANREGLNRSIRKLAHDSHDHARVHAAAKQRTEWNVAHHLPPHGCLQSLLKQGNPVRLRHAVIGRSADGCESLYAAPLVVFYQAMSGR